MPEALWFTDDPKACELLAKDPFALLVGFAIDQQVTVMKAFAGPYVLKERAGTLEPKKLAAMDLEPLFAEKPAIHRFPGAMANRVRELAAVVAEEPGGRGAGRGGGGRAGGGAAPRRAGADEPRAAVEAWRLQRAPRRRHAASNAA